MVILRVPYHYTLINLGGKGGKKGQPKAAAAVVVEYPIIYIYIIVELDVGTVARFILFFTVLSQLMCLKPWF